MSETVEKFEVWDKILHHGNRQDFEYMGDDWASWEADQFEDGTIYGEYENCAALLTVYDDVSQRKFVITWKEVYK